MSVESILDPRSVLLVGSSSLREKVCMTSPEGFAAIADNLRTYFKGTVSVIDIDAHPHDSCAGSADGESSGEIPDVDLGR